MGRQKNDEQGKIELRSANEHSTQYELMENNRIVGVVPWEGCESARVNLVSQIWPAPLKRRRYHPHHH